MRMPSGIPRHWLIAATLCSQAALLATCSPGVYLDECPEGYVVDGVCRPRDCAERTCPAGFICDEQTGLCVEIDCLQVTCGPGEVCANGACYPKDCETRTCPGIGEVCVDEECTHVSCVDVACPAGQSCSQGHCYPENCETKSCEGFGEVCIDGACVQPSCDGVTCPDGQSCAGGVCYPEDCSEVGCFGEGEVCVDGVCQRRACVGVECPDGQVCGNGWCYPQDCDDQDCSDYGELCYEGACIPADCVGIECPDGERCARGVCLPQDCGGRVCEDNEVCIDEHCVRTNCAGIQCPPGERCADGQCFPRDCTDLGCGNEEVCIDGQCVPEDCAHVQCPPGEVCGADLQCHPQDCAGQTCGAYEVCIDDQCTDQLCIGIQCNAGEICVAGICYPTDCGGVPCGADEVCEDGVCIPVDCAGGRCCPPYECTTQNQCASYTCDEGDWVEYTCLFDPAGGQPGWADTGDTCTDNDPCTIDDTCQAGTCQAVPMPCDTDEICVEGVCRCHGTGPDCESGVETCCEPDYCANLETDIDNCGACGQLCRRDHASEQCVGGACSIDQCDALWDDCDGTDPNGCETSLETLTDCGACGVDCAAADATTSCEGGTCHITDCDPGFGDCDGNVQNGCENTLDSLIDCGACGVSCSRDHATASCAGDSCHIESCDPLWDDCNGNDPDGCETSLETLTDCNACGVSCSRDHASAQCPGGNCQILTCDPLWDDCDGSDPNGCETSLETLTDCGACGVSCSAPSATTSCAGGTCHITDCDPLWGDCDGDLLNGCETPLDTLTDCGDCGVVCDVPHGTEECSTGVCRIDTCETLWDDCNGSDPDGCETPLDTLTDCGACGVTCSRPHASAQCPGGTCQILGCDPLWDDCDGNDPNGCETSLETLTDCGSCGTPCSRPHATADCTGGTCHIGSCDPLWDDCNGNDPDGCETSLETLTDCGACGVTCSLPHATPTCAGGTCHIASCDAGWDDCDGNPANGCETPLNTLTDCGACGVTCSLAHASESCASYTCEIVSCDALWDDCDGSDPNGCETSLETLTDCGSCGTPCSRAHATASCNGGSCHIASCDADWDDCDGSDPNGCETSLTTLTDCGACGVTCSLAHASESCATGTCQIVSCSTDWWDADGADSNGCECQDASDVADACGSAVALGTVSSANPSISVSGRIVHRSGHREDQDCYRVDYNSPSPGSGTFQVLFTAGGAPLEFTTWRTDCSSGSCTDSGVFESTCSSTGGACLSGNSNTFMVCVQAGGGQDNLCQDYTLEFQRF